MPTSKNLTSLVINKVESKEVYKYMKNNNLINEDEFYLTPEDNIAIASSSDGIEYTATVSCVESLTAGARFIMIPSVKSESTAPTLNVNGLGAKTLRRRLNCIATTTVPGYAKSWIAVNKPFLVVYDGTYWIVEGMEKPVGADIYGTVPKAEADADGNIITDTYATIAMLQSTVSTTSTVTTLSSAWEGTESPYSHVVNIEGVTESSRVDLQPTGEQLNTLATNRTILNTANDNGTVTVYAVGNKPTEDYTMQVTITEV